MKKLNTIRTIILGLLLLIALVSKAQVGKVLAAITLLEENKLDSAKANIDAAIVHPETANDAQTWQIRGFIYKEIYKTNDNNNRLSPVRIDALNSLKKSIELDVAKEFFSDNIVWVKFLTNTMRNDWIGSLDPLDYKIAIKIAKKYQEYSKIIDPSPAAVQKKEIEFSNEIAKVYYSIVETTNKTLMLDSTNTAARKDNFKFLNLTKNEYNNILAMDSNNISANYSMAILYYNQAVTLIKTNDYDIDLAALAIVVDRSTKLSLESLPFMQRAYKLEPTRTSTLIGMAGIYSILHDTEKSDMYRRELEKIKKPQ